MKEIENVIFQYIREEFITEENMEITTETPLITEGIVDSFSMVSLLRFLETKYKITIPAEKATPENFDTISKISSLVREFLNQPIS